MLYFGIAWFAVTLAKLSHVAAGEACQASCPKETKVVCGFNEKTVTYKMFANQCSKDAYVDCFKTKFDPAPLKFCIESDVIKSRRYYMESCPVFCPEHYRPVCATPRWRGFAYRSFKNKCFLQMLNCRGDDDAGYEEVPLHYCQRHLMKNIFRQQVVVSGQKDYVDF